MSDESDAPRKRARVARPYAEAFEALARDGYVVIEDVVSPELCHSVLARIKQSLREAKIAIDDPKLRMSDYPNTHGIMQHLEIGQQQAVWDVRLADGVQRVFEDMYGDNDLLASTDGICYMPAHYNDRGRQWLHVDQSHQRAGRRCVQGYVNIVTSHDDASGSLSVVPRSHLWHEQTAGVLPRAAANKNDWFRFDQAELAIKHGEDGPCLLGGAEPVRVHGGVGSLVLWDSRTAHSALAPHKDTPAALRRERCVVYVCMQPRAWCTQANMRRKRAVFDEYRMTSHWPATKIAMFGRKWQTYGKPITVVTPPRTRVESARMREIAGADQIMTTRERRIWAPALPFVH